jgi:hypothetical protein
MSGFFGKRDINDELASNLNKNGIVNSAMHDLDKEALKKQNDPNARDGVRPENIIFNATNEELEDSKKG